MSGAYRQLCYLAGDKIWLRALVGAPDGSEIVRGERLCDPQDAAAAGFLSQRNCWITAHGLS